jgi:hypothetical protein
VVTRQEKIMVICALLSFWHIIVIIQCAIGDNKIIRQFWGKKRKKEKRGGRGEKP